MFVSESARFQRTNRTRTARAPRSCRGTRRSRPWRNRRAGDRLPGRLRVEAEDHRRCERDLLTVDPIDAAAADDHVHLFLASAHLVVLDPFHVRCELEPVHPERLHAELAAQELRRRPLDRHPRPRRSSALSSPWRTLTPSLDHMRKTPKVVSGIGAFSAAEMPSASTRRVSSGSMIPSSQRRAVE